MKWLLVLFNVSAAAFLVLLGSFAVAAHRTHAYSVYRELQMQHVLIERPDYDIEKRLRTIAAGGAYSSSIAKIAAAICCVNALAIGLLWKRASMRTNEPLPPKAASPSPTGAAGNLAAQSPAAPPSGGG